METAKSFWLKADVRELGKKWRYDEKTPFEVRAISPHLKGSEVVWDAACGDGRIVKGLKEVCPWVRFFASDLNPRFEYGVKWDLTEGLPEFKFDTVLLLGVIQYLDDDSLRKLFSSLKCKLIIRNSFTEVNTYINGFSRHMGDVYESYYRRLDFVKDMLSGKHKVVFESSVYPPEFESKKGGLQRLLICELA